MKIQVAALVATISCIGMLLGCPDEPFCQACLREYGRMRCVACDQGFFNPVKGSCDFDPNSNVSNCQNYTILKDKVACFYCKLGYMLDIENNKCIKCEAENCAMCKSPDSCIGCFNNLKLDIETKTCIPNLKCKLQNCEVCISDIAPPICGMCTNGFALNLPVDTRCVPAPPNCFIADRENAGKCRNCKPGFYIQSDGTCSQSPSPSLRSHVIEEPLKETTIVADTKGTNPVEI